MPTLQKFVGLCFHFFFLFCILVPHFIEILFDLLNEYVTFNDGREKESECFYLTSIIFRWVKRRKRELPRNEIEFFVRVFFLYLELFEVDIAGLPSTN